MTQNTWNHLKFPMALGLLGFLFSSRSWILFLNRQSPPVGLLIYYVILFITILILQHIGLIVANIPFDTWKHALGTLLIVFSFFIVFDWESLYIEQITNPENSDPHLSNVYLQSEDGAVYYGWYNIMGCSKSASRIGTYVLTPMVLSLLGGLLIHGRAVPWSPI